MNRPAQKAVIRLAVAAFALFAPWAFTAFVMWEPNPGNWSAVGRLFMIGVLLPLTVAASSVAVVCLEAEIEQ